MNDEHFEALVNSVNISAAVDVRRKAMETMTDQVYSQHIGTLLGGKCTLIVTFDGEPKMTAKQWEDNKAQAKEGILEYLKKYHR